MMNPSTNILEEILVMGKTVGDSTGIRCKRGMTSNEKGEIKYVSSGGNQQSSTVVTTQLSKMRTDRVSYCYYCGRKGHIALIVTSCYITIQLVLRQWMLKAYDREESASQADSISERGLCHIWRRRHMKNCWKKQECTVNNSCDQIVMKGVISAYNCYMWTSVKALVSRKNEDAELWHKKLGHTNYRNIQQLISKEAVRGLPIHEIKDNVCGECQVGKLIKSCHQKLQHLVTTRVLELIHTDLMGPMQVKSYGGKNLCYIFDDQEPRQKFDVKSEEDIFLGYFKNNRALLVFNKRTKVVMESMNVKVLDQGLETCENDAEVGAPIINSRTDNTTETPTEDPYDNNSCDDNHPIQPASRIQKNHNVDNIIGQLDEGIEFEETFASVARLEAIRLLLSRACLMKFKLFKMDMKSAFLNGVVEEEVYVEQLKGFVDNSCPQHVYRLKKVLYGLKQAPRAWYERLRKFLLANGYTRGGTDKILFIKYEDSKLMMVQIYVDDIIFGGMSDQLIGLEMHNTERAHLVDVSLLETILCRGSTRNKIQFPYLQLKQNR
ncbi:hypothetical protein LIER_02604 [Lithospermum erythrorhizon]|uniref:Gag-pol polyprotein n=1 Tax=Lithospermum erythrorhizon TaxID=34254 RepID=A0AAV3NRH0_LITER